MRSDLDVLDVATRRFRHAHALKAKRLREEGVKHKSGSTPTNPIPITSASLVEPRALSETCIHRDGNVHLDNHAAVVVDGRRLRKVTLICRLCSARRSVFFSIAPVH